MKPTAIVFVVDDDEAVCEALSSLIRSEGFSVETFRTAREFLKRGPPNVPACLVLDVRLPGLSGLDLQAELAAAHNPIPIIFITGHGSIPLTVRAMKAGAAEFLTKPFRDEEFLQAVQSAIDRDRAGLAIRLEALDLHTRYQSLTPRERDVMKLVVQGMLNKQAAAELGTSEVTIKIHRGQVMRKMQATSLADLVRMAARLGDKLA
jgi:FixJ family two-component response regulator